MEKKVSIYELKISLEGIKPQIYRTVQVKSDVTLARLQNIILNVMGWNGGHLSSFDINGVEYGEDPFGESDFKTLKTKLNKVLTNEKQTFGFLYDFGDSWEHKIVLGKILEPEEGKKYPLCIKGARCCPPEDCGGIFGYMDLVAQLKKPEAERDSDLMEWLEGMYEDGYDPEYFDIKDYKKL